MNNRDKNFDSFSMDYCVQVYDYISNKYFTYKDTFETYKEAHNFIENYDFISDFGEAPIGIYIIKVPHVSLNANISLGGFGNA